MVLVNSVGFPSSQQSWFCMLSIGWYRIAWRSNSLLQIYTLSLQVIFMHFSEACCNTICLHVSWTLLPLSSVSVFLLPFCYFLNINHKSNSHDKMHMDRWYRSLHAVRKKRLFTKRALWPLFQSMAIYVLWYRAPVPGLTTFLWICVITKVNRYVVCGLTQSQLMHRHILLWQNPKRRSVRVCGEKSSNLLSLNTHSNSLLGKPQDLEMKIGFSNLRHNWRYETIF